MDYKKANQVSEILGIVGVVIAFGLYCFQEKNFAFYMVVTLSMLCVVGSIIVTLVFYRCPHCHKPLPFRTSAEDLDYCPRCGNPLGGHPPLD